MIDFVPGIHLKEFWFLEKSKTGRIVLEQSKFVRFVKRNKLKEGQLRVRFAFPVVFCNQFLKRVFDGFEREFSLQKKPFQSRKLRKG